MQGLPGQNCYRRFPGGLYTGRPLGSKASTPIILAGRIKATATPIKQAKDQGRSHGYPAKGKPKPNKGLYDEELYNPPSGRKRFPAPEKMGAVSPRYAKTQKSFLAAVQIRCIARG